ncbi:phenylalanine 4-monooxygenase [Bdellovibrio bacteriovorus]|uniref:Phenylalanine 4-monooxygenase n=1 Tax=Bdellovibrio bacteriovorus TaxID=959 RepID=A0A150WPA3_BDEBC|nr:aromatic amino acid hydroxylase [Bdellovibrio bacteriovorus]KYG66331.1 phenylalanine 4-monooxygenase [Bdellovibrio bacteriovorus]
METEFLPQHLRKYVVEQHYEKYTPVDQAVWRYILRQLKAYLSKHAHECYVEGLEKTGINVEEIPHINHISEKLKKFGWRAMPVSGFIPPAAFMELQSLGVLPVASDMRTLDHLLYTPAPDIVHEAAGHAPILIHPEFSKYLQEYAQIAKKAIISKEDLDLYEAIRELSDIKENPTSTVAEIKAAEENLDRVTKNISHVSEATELSRMNWWTAEYGLIGTLDNPKLFGAGLLSSVGEAKWCLGSHVKKIPLTVDCIATTYDITEPQPQLFVTPDFKTLSRVLEEMASKMAYRIGGLAGINKAIQAQSVNSAELDSGLQISGQIIEAITTADQKIAYLRLNGPSQLCFADKELSGHGKDYHAHGFGTPVGFFKQFPQTSPAKLTDSQWKELGAENGKTVRLEYTSGVVVAGKVQNRVTQNGKTLILTLTDAKATFQDRVLFAPEWGTFDMALGSEIVSVFGGPADRIAYGETTDFVAKRVPTPKYSEQELLRHKDYGMIRQLREGRTSGEELHQSLEKVLNTHNTAFPEDWLLSLEALELLKARAANSSLIPKLEEKLNALSKKDKNTEAVIRDGLLLSGQL